MCYDAYKNTFIFLHNKKLSLKRHLPNSITLLNLLSGSIAVIFVVNGDLTAAAICMALGIVFDFVDGFAARKMGVHSELGLQLDSLADVVTSGLVPGLVMMHLLSQLPHSGWDGLLMASSSMDGSRSLLPWLGLLIPLGAAYRLAVFNISVDQKGGFLGLPTPANAIFIMSLPLILEYQGVDAINGIILNPWTLVVITICSVLLMNLPIPMLAFKFKSYAFRDNAARYLFILLALILLVMFQLAAIPLLLLLYIAVSLLNR